MLVSGSEGPTILSISIVSLSHLQVGSSCYFISLTYYTRKLEDGRAKRRIRYIYLYVTCVKYDKMSHQRYPSHDPVKEPHSISLKVLR
jgi:hypothetical protein